MAGQTYNLKTLLTVTDKLSPTLQKIQKGYADVGKRMRMVGRAAGNVTKPLSQTLSLVKPGVLALAGMAGTIVGTVKAFASYADTLAAVSDKTGVAVQNLQRLRYAAAVNGSSAQEMDDALIKLNKTMADAASGNNARAATLFKTLGISLKDANGRVRSASEVMPQLAEAMRLNTNSALRTQMAMDLFGRSGTKLLPLLKQGSAGLKAMSDRAEKLGLIVSDDAVAAGGELNNTMAELGMSMQAASGEISKSLAPVIKDISERLMVWVKENRELIAVKVAEFVRVAAAAFEKFSEILGKIPWGPVIAGLEVVGSAVIAAKVGSMASSLIMLGKAVIAATGPWGILAAAVVAVVAAIVANWDKIVAVTKRMAGEAMTALTAIGDAFLDSIKNAVEGVKSFVNGVPDFFSSIWNGIVETVSDAVKRITGIFPDWLKRLVSGGSDKQSIVVTTKKGAADDASGASGRGGATGQQEQGLVTPNRQAMSLSAAGAVTGSVDVNVRNQATGETQTRKAPLRGQVRVSGNPGEMRPAYDYGGD
jgi:hypothetical protein